MRVKKLLCFSIAFLLIFSTLFGGTDFVEASAKNPQKAAVISKLYHPTTTVIHTDVYLNKTQAKKLSKKLKNKQTKKKDVGAYLVSLVPYIGPFLGAGYMIEGWKNQDNAKLIDKKLKSNKGIRVVYIEVQGRGKSAPTLANIYGWSGKASTVKSHHKVTKAQKKSPFKHTVKKKIYK